MLSKFNRVLPRLGAMAKQSKFTFATAGGKDLSAQNKSTGISRRDRLQFSKERLTDFGDLPVGEIPEALKWDRQTETSSLTNGVRVATQHWNGDLATITVLVKAGSRNETIETSGTANFLTHLNLRGTSNRNRGQLESELAAIGGQITAKSCRETTQYTLTVFKDQVSKAVEILGDVLVNSTYDKNQVEAERESVYRSALDVQKDQLETTWEAVHYTSFRDHMLGQPKRGIRENIANITQDNIVDFHKANYVGPNVVVVGAGNVNHQQLVDLTQKALGNLPSQAGEVKGADQPFYTPSLLYMRDDEMANVNIGVVYNAPSWTHEDHYAFRVFNEIIGEYNQSKHTGQHLNSSDRQYNTMHRHLGSLPDVTLQKSFYQPYSDTGIFGSYLHGNEVHSWQMLYISQLVASDWANYLNVVEVFRAKNKLYNELLQQETGAEVSTAIANELLYLNRAVPRSEVATRIANLEQPHLTRVARHWLFDTEVSAVAWGPIHALMGLAHYNRPLRRSSLGWYGDSLYHIN